jgi:hypothetical protein
MRGKPSAKMRPRLAENQGDEGRERA